MLAVSMVNEIRRLLATGNFSQRKIARMTGVSRGTIGAIASGKRPDYEARREEDDEYERPMGPPQRCPSCGAMVYMPCRLCALRRRLAAEAGKSRPQPVAKDILIEPLGMNLRHTHRKRYEKIHKRKMQAVDESAAHQDLRDAPFATANLEMR